MYILAVALGAIVIVTSAVLLVRGLGAKRRGGDEHED